MPSVLCVLVCYLAVRPLRFVCIVIAAAGLPAYYEVLVDVHANYRIIWARYCCYIQVHQTRLSMAPKNTDDRGTLERMRLRALVPTCTVNGVRVHGASMHMPTFCPYSVQTAPQSARTVESLSGADIVVTAM